MSHLQQYLCSSNIWSTSGLIPLFHFRCLLCHRRANLCFALSHKCLDISQQQFKEKNKKSDKIWCLITTSLLPDRLYFQIDQSVLTGVDIREASRGYLQTGSRSCGTSLWLYLFPVSTSHCGKGSPCDLSPSGQRALSHDVCLLFSCILYRAQVEVEEVYVAFAPACSHFKLNRSSGFLL